MERGLCCCSKAGVTMTTEPGKIKEGVTAVHFNETAYSKWRIIRSRKMFFSKTWIGQGGAESRGRPWVVLQLMKEALDGANMETCTMMGRQTEHTTQQENKSSEAALFKAAWRTGDTTLTPLMTQLLSSAGIHSPPTNVNNKSQSERFYEVNTASKDGTDRKNGEE
ncbi:uncharacterized protein LOC101161280 isoform X1 [Oryzias latipes]|uniref:uncharacterized protein LOC101161280 isoform X1 n=1 Tax=Oryzias latipes TaxID=8090 RepID=UPI0009DA81D8|nr:uncharacterized protein LOC101161280 isoform X1 [Oryzias latipes]